MNRHALMLYIKDAILTKLSFDERYEIAKFLCLEHGGVGITVKFNYTEINLNELSLELLNMLAIYIDSTHPASLIYSNIPLY